MITNLDEYDIEMTDEEVSFLIMKYLVDQKHQGRDLILLSEIFTYLECEMPDDIEDTYLITHDELEEEFIKENAKRNKHLN